ncbi:MAG: ABC transporter substrate-binding protein [Actinobacteria bacterium]|nr:ABC transporter substrate-binding protein [Actinomycetota bacterium]
MIASVGTISGPAGAALSASVQALQVWAKSVNSRGGVNGHPVQLIVYDDTGDPARHRSQVQDAIERQHVIAFVQNNEAIAGRASVDYITQKRVPVIGSETGSPWFYESPIFFPQASSGDMFVYGAIASAAEQLIPQGKKTLGTLVCVEAQQCAESERVFKQ